MKKSFYILILLFCSSCYVPSQKEVLQKEILQKEVLLLLEPDYLSIYDDCYLCPSFNYNINGEEEESGFTNTYLKSSKKICMYAPSNTTDGDPKTAWVEGVEGSGIGAEVIIPELLDVNKPVKIWAGYGKSETLFYANNRPKKVKVSILKARRWGDWYDPHDAIGCSFAYGGFQTVGSRVVSLKDINGYQELQLPDFPIEKYKDFPESYYSTEGGMYAPEDLNKTFWDYAYFLKLEILEVYKGIKYDDTCISEIRN